jgi:hypothetical protein
MLSGWLKTVAPAHFSQVVKPTHDGKFHLFEARRGRGKSYSLAQWAFAAANQGIPIRSNNTLFFYWFALELCKAKKFKSLVDAFVWCNNNIIKIESWDDVCLAYDSIVILDESNRLFDSRDSKRDGAPDVAFEWLQQSRKMRLTIIFAAQGFDWLNVRIRQLADTLWRAKKEMDKKNPQRILNFWNYGSDPFSNGLNATVVRDADMKMKIPFTIARARLYNTHEIIRALDDKPHFTKMIEYEDFLIEMGIVVRSVPIYTVDTIPLEQDAYKLIPGPNYALRGRLSKNVFQNPETVKTAFEFTRTSKRDEFEREIAQTVLDWA